VIGQKLGPYEVLAKLGEGGMGVVYRARDPRLDRDVAIKVLTDRIASDPAAAARLAREARAASALDHPNIAAVYDVGETAGRPFIVMALLEGQTLGRRLDTPVPMDEALSIAQQIAEGLQAAHARGIIHRDIKPANIFITSRGEVKILDFGLAKTADQTRGTDGTTHAGAPELTDAGTAVGTAAYMSPEQARGEPVDERSDLFSTGAVLYELFTGRRAFDGDTIGVIYSRVLEHAPPPARSISRDLPEQIENVLSKALEKDRRLRYQSVADLAADLARVARDRSASRASTAAVAARPARTARSPAFRMALAAAAVLGIAALWWVFSPSRGASADPIDSVAVLPFVNATGDADRDYLSDGLTDSLINALAQVPGLRVVPRSTMFQHRGTKTDPLDVARSLGVRAVVSGEVTQRGEALTINARLVDVDRQAQLWGDLYDRRMADLATVQSDIAGKIFANLRLRLTGEAASSLIGRHTTTNTEALNLFYRGLYHRQKTTEEGFRTSLRYFQEAVERDPKFALAYVGLSDSYGALGYLQVAPPGEVWPRAKAAAEAALALDPTLAEAHAALGHAILRYDWNPATAKAELDRAIALNPRHAIAHHWMAHYYLAYEPGPRIMAESREAVTLEPGDLMLNAHLVFMMAGGPLDRLAEDVNRIRQIDPEFWAIHTGQGFIRSRQKQVEDARREFQQAADKSGRMPLAVFSLGFFEVDNNRQAVDAIIAELARRPAPPPYYIAMLYRRLDDEAKTVEWLQRGLRERNGAMIDLHSWPDSWKKRPAIAKILEEMHTMVR
jgi:TolB-like protein/tRNA A-37 threonylcarbamoyl transferase component Bud32